MTLLSDATMLEEEDQMVPYSSIIEVLSLEQIAKVAEMATTMMADFKPENNGLSCGMTTASQCSGIDTTGALSPNGTLSPNPETEKCYINLDKWQSELSNNNGYNDLSMYDDLQTPTNGFTTTQSPNGTLRNFGLPQVRSCTPQSLSAPQCVKNLNSTGNAGLCNGLNVFKNAMETTVTSTNGMYGATVKTEVQDDYDCPVEEIVMDQVRRDMQLACTRLDIPPDPYQWTPNQTKAWVAWNIDQFRLHAVNLAYFDMNGTTLCMLSEDDFKARAPLGGEMLYAQLEIWRNGFKLFEITPPTSPSSPSSGYCQQYNGVRCPSKGSVPSPCPSTDSSDSAYSAASLTSPRRGFVEPHHNSYNTMFQYDQQCNGTEPEPQPQPHTGRQNIHLWQFLKELLSQPQHYGNAIRWVDRSKGIFKIEDSARVARLWGKRKNRPAMNYDKLSRSIRQYYKKGIIKKTEQSKRLVYQFCHPYLL